VAGSQVSYTQLAIAAVASAVIFDLLIAKTHLLARKLFWTSYAIVISFQLLTNWWLTSRNIVMYDPAVITGVRIASAPIEDLLFGFALVLGVLSNWIRLGALEKRR
jgi:lycopene cyclase domain-containing protein